MNTARIITIVSFLVLMFISSRFTPDGSFVRRMTWISQPGVYVQRPASVSLATDGGREAKRFSTNFPDLEHIFWWYGRYAWK